MSADVPRRLPPTQGERVRNIDRSHASLSARGRTASARPVPQSGPTATIYQPPTSGSGVLTGTINTADPQVVSITSTAAGAGTSVATGSTAIAIGLHASATGDGSVGVGVATTAPGGDSISIGDSAACSTDYGGVAVGGASRAFGDRAVAVGATSYGGADGAAAVGSGASAYELNSVAVGKNASAEAAGAVALGADSTGAGAEASGVDEFVLGTQRHHVIVPGGLILADSAGGLHRLVVSTGGALSTVAYP